MTRIMVYFLSFLGSHRLRMLIVGRLRKEMMMMRNIDQKVGAGVTVMFVSLEYLLRSKII